MTPFTSAVTPETLPNLFEPQLYTRRESNHTYLVG